MEKVKIKFWKKVKKMFVNNEDVNRWERKKYEVT